MSDINPMELLKQSVTSVMMSEQTHQINEKNDILSRFYPILLLRFLTKPQLIDELKALLKPSVLDVFEKNNSVKNSLIQRLAATQVSAREVELLLNRAIPKSLAVLSSQIGHDAVTLIYYLRQHKHSIYALLPVWSREVLSPLDLDKIEKNLESIKVVSVVTITTQQPNKLFLLVWLFVIFFLIGLYQWFKIA